jgi:hypothetical protein
MKTSHIPTIAFWTLSISILAFVACFWILQSSHLSRTDPERTSKALCLINIRNMQAAVRSYQKQNNLQSGTKLRIEEMIKEGFMTSFPCCPDGQSYVYDGTIPKEGELYLRCLNRTHMDFEHNDW